MPVTYVSGDPLLTHAQAVAFGHNARGRTELGSLETALFTRYPAAFSTYRKQCNAGRIKTGTYWLWRESAPLLVFLVVRETPVGATRLRYVQSAVMALARDYQFEGIHSLALAPLGNSAEQPALRQVIAYWLGKAALPVFVYNAYAPGLQAREDFPLSDMKGAAARPAPPN